MHFEVFCDDVFGDNGGELKEVTEKHKLFQVHIGELMLEVIEGGVFI